MNIDHIIAYEQGELNLLDTLTLFACGIKSGMVWQLQGHYGRTAKNFIDNGLIKVDGTISRKRLQELSIS
jgi:hypothetical protein